jgi:hypothetical protein
MGVTNVPRVSRSFGRFVRKPTIPHTAFRSVFGLPGARHKGRSLVTTKAVSDHAANGAAATIKNPKKDASH